MPSDLPRAAMTGRKTQKEDAAMSSILIVDDDDAVRLTLRILLECSGHHVDEAGDGRTGLKALGTGNYDLVITDIIMPDCEGIEFIRAALKAQPNRKIIAMSAGGRTRNTEFLDIARKSGAKAILPKPFEPEALMSAIKLALA